MIAIENKRTEWIDSIKTYAYGTNEKKIHTKEEIKWINLIKQYKKKFKKNVTTEKIKDYNPNWPEIPDYQYILWITWGYWSGKIKASLNFIKYYNHDECSVINTTHLYVIDPNE